MPASSCGRAICLYNFPTWLDGRGQTIGILEFGGSIGYEDLASYFSMLNLPVPDVASISVAGGREESDFGADGQVMMDIEIAAAIAPRARIRVYFAPWGSAKGWHEAINRASADRVSVFVVGWGQPEIEWKDSEMRQVNTALQQLAEGGVTIVAAAGDKGMADGVPVEHRSVDFPASSPWVLAIGGTTLACRWPAHRVRNYMEGRGLCERRRGQPKNLPDPIGSPRSGSQSARMAASGGAYRISLPPPIRHAVLVFASGRSFRQSPLMMVLMV
jgi:subtilase family serine protease